MGYKVLAGRYEIHGKIGDGGMAVVYEARDKLLNRLVAIKVLRPEYVKDKSFIDNFRRESRAAAGLNQPNIVSIFDVGKEGNIYYIVMELIKGRPLSEIIKERAPMPYSEVISVGTQIAAALSFAHKNNIIHRDVKPHNIMITEEGSELHAKITDFGIARAVTDRTTVSDNNVIMGSVHYFSPEQGRGKYVDERSDIYSLGIVLFEMLTGKVPFDADEPIAIALKHMNEPIIPPSRLVEGIPPGLDQIILHATQKIPVDRFSSAEEMKEALENVERLTNSFGTAYVPGGARNDDDWDDGAYDDMDDDYPDDSFDDDYDDDDWDDEDWDDELDDGIADEDDFDQVKGKKGKKNRTPEEKKRRKLKTFAIIAAIVLALALCYPLFRLIGMIFAEKTVVVPDLVGYTQEQAEALLEKDGLKLIATPHPSDEYDEGVVTAQNPKAGDKISRGGSVSVNVSSGPPGAGEGDGTVPDLAGMSKAQAEYAIQEGGYILGEVETENSEQPMDTVIAQIPEAGLQLDPGEPVNITLSLGPKTSEVDMPNLIGLSESQAKSAITDAGLVVGSITRETSDDIEKDKVMWQQYKKGTSLSEGQTVKFRLSDGPESKTSTVSIEVNLAEGPQDPFNLTVSLTNGDGTKKTIISNEERRKEGKETVSVKGTGSGGKIQVYFDGALKTTYDADFNTGKVTKAG